MSSLLNIYNNKINMNTTLYILYIIYCCIFPIYHNSILGSFIQLAVSIIIIYIIFNIFGDIPNNHIFDTKNPLTYLKENISEDIDRELYLLLLLPLVTSFLSFYGKGGVGLKDNSISFIIIIILLFIIHSPRNNYKCMNKGDILILIILLLTPQQRYDEKITFITLLSIIIPYINSEFLGESKYISLYVLQLYTVYNYIGLESSGSEKVEEKGDKIHNIILLLYNISKINHNESSIPLMVLIFIGLNHISNKDYSNLFINSIIIGYIINTIARIFHKK